MAVQGRYTDPLQVSETPETRERITKIADDEGISQAQVIRDIIDHGLSWRERKSESIIKKKEQSRG